MAGLFTPPFFDVGSGIKPADGAKLSFKIVGSDTNKDTFTTAAADIEHSNPVIANSAGVFPQIYLIADYDWILTNKNNVQISTGSVSEFVTGSGQLVNVLARDTLNDAVIDTSLQDGLQINIAERTTGNGGGAMLDVVLSSTVTEDTFSVVQCTGVATLSLVLRPGDHFTPKKIGAVGDGVADDILALDAFAAYSKANKIAMYGGGPNCFYRISAEWIITHDAPFYGEMCQVFQETANVDCITWDKGLGAGANNQSGMIIKDIVIATVAGTGNGYTFRNINESHISDLLVVGVGNTSFQVEGSLLTTFIHPYTGDGLSLSPGFFTNEFDSGCVNGIVHATHNGLGPNKCTYIRPSVTNATGVGIDVATGTGCTFMNLTLEGIADPAIHMKIDRKTTVINGDLENTGKGILITADNCVIIGMNNLSFVNLAAGVKGCHITGGTHKFPVITAGANNNTLENFEIGVGGSFVGMGAGTDNTIKNITGTSGDEIGSYRGGTFTPELLFGGANVDMTYFQKIGTFFIDGDRVDFKVRLQLNAKGSSTGSVTIDLSDLPFNTADDNIDTVVNIHQNGIALGSGNILGNRLTENSDQITLFTVLDTTGANTALSDSAFASGEQMWVTGFFHLN